MQLTMKQMQYQILIAYQMNKAKNNARIEFRYDVKRRACVTLCEHAGGTCKMVELYEFYGQDKKIDNFKSIIAVLNGEKSLFNETAIERETRATEELF